MIPRTTLLDERSSPPLRRRLGALLAAAGTADFAVARIRLARIDLAESELGGLARCRVLVGRLDAGALTAPGGAGEDDAAGRVRALLGFVASGRLEVRAAGLGVWHPDFSVLRGIRDGRSGRTRAVALVGGHYFAEPDPPGGPSFTCILPQREAVERAARRFEELWARGYDVLPVVREALARLAGAATDARA